MILGICFFLVREKGEKIRGGGGQIYWTYSLLVPNGRHSELVLKKVRILSVPIHHIAFRYTTFSSQE